MKAKILIFPLIIVLIIWLAIAKIAPAFGEMRAQSKNLKIEKAKLADIQQKNKNVDKLIQELNNYPQQNVVFNYVPKGSQEEELIDTLSSLASGSGVSVYNLAVVKTQPKADAPAAEISSEGDVSDVTVTVAGQTPKPSNVDVSIGVVGNYDGIKSFLDKVISFKRYNNISMLKIAKAVSSTDTATDALQTDIKIGFNYLEKKGSAVNADDNIFKTGKFDMSVVDGIVKATSTDIQTINLGTVGKTNPFAGQ